MNLPPMSIRCERGGWISIVEAEPYEKQRGNVASVCSNCKSRGVGYLNQTFSLEENKGE